MKSFVISCLLLLSYPLSGQQIQFSSLADVFRYADHHSTSIRTAYLQEQVYASQEREARRSLLPSLNASAGMTDNITLQGTLVPAQLFDPTAPEGTFATYTFGKKYLYTTGVQINWDILNWQKWMAIETASAQAQLGIANTRQAQYQVYQALAGTYYTILLNEKYQALYLQNLETSRQIYTHAEEKYRTGIISEDARNLAKIQELKAAHDLKDLENHLQQLYLQFQSQLNLDQNILLTEQLDSSGNVWQDQNITSLHPEMIVQEAQLKIAQAKLRQAQHSSYPVLSLGYQYNYSWATDQLLDFSGVNELPQQSLGLKLSIPIFNGLSGKEQTARAKLNVLQQEEILSNTSHTINKEDMILQTQYRRAVDALREMEDLLTLQKVNDQHTNNKYQGGLISLDERLDKYQDLLNLQNQYLQSLSDYYVSYYKLYIRQIQ